MTQINSIDTGHEELIHDAQLDYYGTKLATCSSDKTIRVFDVINHQQKLIADLKGHEGPVWQLSWSHPMYGSLLASCSYDKKVIIWKETSSSTLPTPQSSSGGSHFQIIHEYDRHTSSVNTVAWAPYEYGLMLACGSSDGSISIITSSGDGRWTAKNLPDCHPPGVNALSWARSIGTQISASAAMDDSSLTTGNTELVKRFVSGGCDNLVRIWKEQDDAWIEESHLDQHTDWIRDVAWAPTFGLSKEKIASCSQDGRVYVWTRDVRTQSAWECTQIGTVFDDVVWSVSWSLTGDILAVASADKVSLWKEGLDGKYQCLTTPTSAMTATNSITDLSDTAMNGGVGGSGTQATSSLQAPTPLMVS
ncbi:unnamed protein product [Didymodactylos carnosus]|uniref:Protein SEC13 homolog n=1 Tax=Didymodactylos carnosus TaxID=1234261 RepID=A0A814CBF3_9BILA|nr:unnamed protein product [Didymodactylos carnosus]CAF0937799.1 unnamed protein product [Didymodactylos carnosus]CAF3660820.1 unnamed protein product [Didymodactylos carnosus]CAF3714701.1 unnamed protein product [Didymodactylos carnosus]